MNRKLLVTLLHKNIEELNMITNSFMEMDAYSAAIILLAKRKTEDIQLILDELATAKSDVIPLEFCNKEIDNSNNTDSKSNLNNTFTLDELEVNAIEVPIESKKVEFTEINTDSNVEETEIITLIEPQDETTISFETNELKEQTEVIENHHIILTTDETKKTILVDKGIPTVLSRNELLSKTDNSLSAIIANKKITDIKQAINIGDRFRFQRELFKGNGEDMNKTLVYINQLATLNEAIAFLNSKYGWDESNETAEDFRQIVKRKFL